MLRQVVAAAVSRVNGMGRFFYAVRRGRETGVFETWDDCKLQVNGFAGARYKKFGSEAEAWDFVKDSDGVSNGPVQSNSAKPAGASSGQPKPGSTPQYPSKKACPTTSSTTAHIKPSTRTSSSWSKPLSSSFASKSFTAAQKARSTSKPKSTILIEAQRLAPTVLGVDAYSPGCQQKRLCSTDSQSDEEQHTSKRRRIGSASAAPAYADPDGLIVYTDGACSHNGAKGARAGLGVYWGDGHPLNYCARLEGKQTNQRAELTAAIKALEQVKEHHSQRKVTLFTDSKYTIQCVTEWIQRWKQNGWKTSQKTDVVNKEDLVKLDALNRQLDIRWEYVPGHQNIHGNERADRLAREGAAQPLSGKER